MNTKSSSNFWKKFQKRLKYTFTNPFTYLFLLIVVFLVASTCVVRRFEPYHPEGEVTNWKDAIWHSIVAIVAAYYDYYMKTVPGRLASLVLLVLGMAFWTIIMGKITSSIMGVQAENNKGLKKLRRMKGHFLLCGWREDLEKILDAVIDSNPEIPNDMIVLVNNGPVESIEILRGDLRFKEIKFVSGDFSDADVLKRAYIETAGRALVISDYANGNSRLEIDSRTVLSVMTMKSLNPDIYVSAELLSEKFKEQLQMSHCDEIVLTQEYEYSLLATASSGLGYSNVIKALISDNTDSGIIIEDISKNYFGSEYKKLASWYENSSKTGDILVGLLFEEEKGKQTRPLFTPSEDFIIPSGAKAVLIRRKEEGEL